MSSYIIFQSYIQTYENVKRNLEATLVLPDLQVILSLDEKALLKAIRSFFLTSSTIECLLDAWLVPSAGECLHTSWAET